MDSASLSAFAPRAPQINETSGTAELRTAIVNDELLSGPRSVQDRQGRRSRRSASPAPRSAESLAAGDRAVREAAVQLASNHCAERTLPASPRREAGDRPDGASSSRTSGKGSVSSARIPGGSYAVSRSPAR